MPIHSGECEWTGSVPCTCPDVLDREGPPANVSIPFGDQAFDRLRQNESPPSFLMKCDFAGAHQRRSLTGCGKTRPRRGSGDPDHEHRDRFSHRHMSCVFIPQHGDVPMKSGQVPSPLHVFPQRAKSEDIGPALAQSQLGAAARDADGSGSGGVRTDVFRSWGVVEAAPQRRFRRR